MFSKGIGNFLINEIKERNHKMCLNIPLYYIAVIDIKQSLISTVPPLIHTEEWIRTNLQFRIELQA